MNIQRIKRVPVSEDEIKRLVAKEYGTTEDMVKFLDEYDDYRDQTDHSVYILTLENV